MNLGLSELMKIKKNLKVQCLLVEFDEGKNSSSRFYKSFVDSNFTKLGNIVNDVSVKHIKLLKGSGRKIRRVGDREAANIIKDYIDIRDFSDIIVDISALPRSIFFLLIGKIITLLDKEYAENSKLKHNLFILTAENAKLDANTIEEGPDLDLNYTFGFSGGLELENHNPIIWFPI